MQNFVKTILSAVKTWTQGKIKESITASTADWNQNDKSADNYVKNRTHWEEKDGTIHKLDSKYLDLPTNLATTDDVQEAVEIANETQNTANNKMDKNNPVGTGSFSMNRKSDADIGISSSTLGYNCIASGHYSHAEGYNAKTLTVLDRYDTFVDSVLGPGFSAHAEGSSTRAVGYASHAEGNGSLTIGSASHAEGAGTSAVGDHSHASGLKTVTKGASSFVYGEYNANYETPYDILDYLSSSKVLFPKTGQFYCSEKYIFDQTTSTYTLVSPILVSAIDIYALNDSVINKYFVIDFNNSMIEDSISGSKLIMPTSSTTSGSHNTLRYYIRNNITLRRPSVYNSDRYFYAHIVGNGTAEDARSNAHTLDWKGNAWYSGDVYVGSTSGTNKDEGSKKLATEEFVNTSIANLVDSAPDTLNTLNELATAIQENDNIIDTLNATITNKVTIPQNAVAGDLLIYDGTNWVCISKADLIAEIIAALPNAEEASF